MEGTFTVVDQDTPLYWLWCGTECSGAWIGPHSDRYWAKLDADTNLCVHDHAIFEMSIRQMAGKLPDGVTPTFDGRYWMKDRTGFSRQVIMPSLVAPSFRFALSVHSILDALILGRHEEIQVEDAWEAAW